MAKGWSSGLMRCNRWEGAWWLVSCRSKVIAVPSRADAVVAEQGGSFLTIAAAANIDSFSAPRRLYGF